ncbi:pyridoxamine 5'-phosphate oxidase family protein [uncultured Alsobacter sp.]|uniref:pyridoxamine 5'-phosphate oxidase family protein n=1 Tax=uncultured Alsobacter sp. TaxID=1748258 RepID=UPI0025F3CA9A|nr:pyridoxamine 5'-phosphate oxidase family protein [uncultured Alsobacter sp.]
MAIGPDLQAVLSEATRLLSRAVADRRSPMHTPTIATVAADGRPRLRTVVLRGFDTARRELRFHTDARSPKVAEMTAEPRIGIHVYDPGAKVQIRVDATVSLHADGGIADNAWLTSQPMSRVCYATRPAPGSPIGEGGSFSLPANPQEVETGRANFVAVIARIDALEWLHLAQTGHRRACFSWTGDDCEGTWLAP